MKVLRLAPVFVFCFLNASFAQTPQKIKIISFPGEVEGQSLSLKVLDAPTVLEDGITYKTIPEKQVVETSAFYVELDQSTVKVGKKGELLGFLPREGYIKKRLQFEQFEVRDTRSYHCFLEVGAKLRPVSACPLYGVKFSLPDGSTFTAESSWRNGLAQLSFQPNGNIGRIFYEVRYFELQDLTLFPTVQGETLSPKSGADVLMDIVFHEGGGIKLVQGRMARMTYDPSTISSRLLKLATPKLEAQLVEFWKYGQLRLGLTPEGLVDSVVLDHGLRAQVNGADLYLTLYFGDYAAKEEYSSVTSPKYNNLQLVPDPAMTMEQFVYLKDKRYPVVPEDGKLFELLSKLCKVEGYVLPVESEKSAFNVISFELDYDVTSKKKKVYDSSKNKEVTIPANSTFFPISTIRCPHISQIIKL